MMTTSIISVSPALLHHGVTILSGAAALHITWARTDAHRRPRGRV